MNHLIHILLVFLAIQVSGQGEYHVEDDLRLDEKSNIIDSVQQTIDSTANIAKPYEPEYIKINGEVYPALIENGDTLILANIDDVSISSPRTFDNAEDYRKYMKYKAYAAKVYPYAKEAIKIFRQFEYATETLSKRKRKKYVKQLQEDLKVKFEDPLSKLSKTQGKIMVKMIEKELDTPMYDLIKNLRGRFRAFYWDQFSKLYGYRLKTGYIDGANPILDAVIQDLDISYDIELERYN